MSIEITPITTDEQIGIVSEIKIDLAPLKQAKSTIENIAKTTEEGLQDYVEYQKETTKTVLDSIGNFLQGLFGLKNTHKEGTVEYYEYEFKNLTQPQTEEFKAHDEYMDEVMAEYYEKNPKPENTTPLTYIGIGSDSDILKWWTKTNEYREAQEIIYREEHPEYANQGEAWDNVQQQKQFKKATEI